MEGGWPMIQRYNAPETNNKYYLNVAGGGYNRCIKISGFSVLPNCVGYAYGRAYEVLGTNPKLSTGNAAGWYGHNDKWKRVKPDQIQPGDVICWDDGGCGHVGFVELRNADGSFTISQSAYGGSRFYLTKQRPPFDFGRFTCQGGIRIAPEAAYNIKEQSGDIKTTSYRNCYTDPSSKSTRLKRIEAGAKLHYSRVCGTWHYIESFGGWISLKDKKGTYFDVIKLPTRKFKTLYGMNVRRYPDKSSTRTGSVAKGKRITTRDVCGDWVYMIGAGWICTKENGDKYLEAVK